MNEIKKSIFIYNIQDLRFYCYGTQVVVILLFGSMLQPDRVYSCPVSFHTEHFLLATNISLKSFSDKPTLSFLKCPKLL